MSFRSQWPNEQMWERAVGLRQAGLTYLEIAGRLAKEFELEDVPSDDTVRRQVSRRLAAAQDTPVAGDTGLGEEPAQAERSNHWPALRKKALGIKYQLHVPVPELLGLPYHFWPNAAGPLAIDDPASEQEREADPLFESLKQHLEGHPVWSLLTQWSEQVRALRTVLAGLAEGVAATPGLEAWPLEHGPSATSPTQERTLSFDRSVALLAFETASEVHMPKVEYAAPSLSGGWLLEWHRSSSYVVLGSSQDREGLDSLRDLHMTLPASIDASPTVEPFRVLEEQERAVGAELARISKMATFPGRCSLWTA